MFYVYLITNLVNGKIYVGKTCQSLKERWQTHLRSIRRGKVSRLYNAIRKYGQDNFTMDVLSETASKTSLNIMETAWIDLLSSRNKSVGYNMTSGGDGGDTMGGRKHTAEAVEKIRQWHTGKILSPETVTKLKNRPKTYGEDASHFNHNVSTAEVVEMYQTGKTTRQIAKHFGVEKTLIKGRLVKAGVPLRLNPRQIREQRLIAEGKTQFLEIDNEELAGLYNSGHTTEEIAAMYELTGSAVRNRLIKVGVTLRPGGPRMFSCPIAA